MASLGRDLASGFEELIVYGLIGKIVSVAGKRVELAGILADMEAMPGCMSYVVANDSSDPNALWVTEVWETSEAHTASLEFGASSGCHRSGAATHRGLLRAGGRPSRWEGSVSADLGFDDCAGWQHRLQTIALITTGSYPSAGIQ